MLLLQSYLFFFFFNDTATTEIYTLSLHDALPISAQRRERRPVEGRHRAAVNDDVAGIRLQQPHHMLEGHALPRAGIADDDRRLAVLDAQRESLEHGAAVERLAQVLKLDHRSSTRAQKASSTSSSTAEYTTARVVLLPTPSAPPRVESPTTHPTRVMVHPNVALLKRPNQVSFNR